jgi:hypothetical protein
MPTGGRRAILRGAALLSAAVVAGGCTYLTGFPPDTVFPEPSTVATYTSGQATVALKGGETIVLDRLAAPGTLVTMFGSEVTWRNDGGWYVRLHGLAPSGSIGSIGGPIPPSIPYLQLDRIVDGAHWTTFTFGPPCSVDVEQADERGVLGGATCRGLRWSDAMSAMSMTGEPLLVPGEDPFDAEITFEASPAD